MFKKIATTLAATALGVASAQSWTDAAGLCPDFYETGKSSKYAEPADKGYYPKKELISIDDPSLHEIVFEYDTTTKRKKLVDASIKCMSFFTQGGEETRKQSERFCVEDKYKTAPLAVNYTIPLWNVKKIETNVVEDLGIVDMTFTMRYTNFSNATDSYYKDEDKIFTS